MALETALPLPPTARNGEKGREQPHQTGLILDKALESWDAVKYPSGSKW